MPKTVRPIARSGTIDEHTEVALRGGKIVRNARQELELQTGKSAISALNAKSEKILGKGK